MYRILTLVIFVFRLSLGGLDALASEKYVLTETPGSGKTTILQVLKRKGFQVRPEAYATLFHEAKQQNLLDRFFGNPLEFRQNLMDQQLEFEADLDPSKPAFMDRGTIDIIAFGEYYNLPTPEKALQADSRRAFPTHFGSFARTLVPMTPLQIRRSHLPCFRGTGQIRHNCPKPT